MKSIPEPGFRLRVPILRNLLDRVIEDPSLNTRDKLMPIVEELAAKR